MPPIARTFPATLLRPAAPVKAKAAAPVKAAGKPPASGVLVAPRPAQLPQLPAQTSAATHAPLAAATGPMAAGPAARLPADSSNGFFVAEGGADVVVDIQASDSGYANRIYWSADNFVTRHYLGIDNETASLNLGSLAAGTRIDFGIVNGPGDFFRTGPASANADHFEHARSATVAGGQQIGFEDLSGGGDRDFNDAVLLVRAARATPPLQTALAADGSNRSGLAVGAGNGPVMNVERQNASRSPVPSALARSNAGTPPALAPTGVAGSRAAKLVTAAAKALAAAAAASTAAARPVLVPAKPPGMMEARPAAVGKPDNRSGLGDGTNPGQGAGREGSPNVGTHNPSTVKATSELAARAGSLYGAVGNMG